MLRHLTVKNYAIIQELGMDFGDGLTIITGETGAGKSILLGALGLVLGERADTSVLLNSEEKCVVEAEFNIRGYDLEETIEAAGLDYEDNITLRREITPAGKSRAFLNDTPVNLPVMKELGDRLIDVHSQHQTLLLGSSLFQMRVIDACAGSLKLSAEYSALYRSYLKARGEYEEALSVSDRERADYEYYLHQYTELESLKLIEGEQVELEKEQERLSNASEIKESLSGSSAALSGEDVSALSLLRSARNGLSRIRGWLPEAGELEKRLESAFVELNDIAYEAEKLNDNISDDPGRLEYVTGRLDTIYTMLQKHRCRDLEELLSKQEEIGKRVRETAFIDERLEQLKAVSDRLLAELMEKAGVLSAERQAIVPDLENSITDRLRLLGMPHARFAVRITRLASTGPAGLDRADFLFTANRQVEPEELSRIASGGELSRVMLCLKSMLASSSGLPTIIFDEIDSGVSGEVASMVGGILEEMGASMQVINITHLPQVASRGALHYHVYKEDLDHSTITRVKLLSKEERLQEIARLLSGSRITDAAMHNARELLKGR